MTCVIDFNCRRFNVLFLCRVYLHTQPTTGCYCNILRGDFQLRHFRSQNVGLFGVEFAIIILHYESLNDSKTIFVIAGFTVQL